MVTLIVRRLLGMIPIILGVAVVTFFLVRVVPGDPVGEILGENYDPAVAADLREKLGLDAPLATQFWEWLRDLATGNLGTSIRSELPVTTEIATAFPYTLKLSVGALTLAMIFAIPLGVLAARRRDKPADLLARAFAVVGISVPTFVVGILLILLFAVQLQVLPSSGVAPEGSGIVEQLRYLCLPVVTLSIAMMVVTLKMTRSSYLEVAKQDFIRTALAKGVRRRRVTTHHALRTALLPVVTSVGIEIGYLLGGTVVVETVFSQPGVGSLLLRAIGQRDYPMVTGTVMFLALVFVLANLLSDVLYIVVDPRLRRA
ncbi:ABC transporter permease [Dactylosporangium sp. NPDC050688]|uniref:ABC transporter permease n=1 Tax=Dactylosporangium sp. NPDC050688 TaxID=3157217 RepID=UPI0033CFFEF2